MERAPINGLVLVRAGWHLIATLAVTSALPAQQPEIVRSTAPAGWSEKLRLVEEVRIGNSTAPTNTCSGALKASPSVATG